MSMHAARFGDYPIPEETYQVAHRAFTKGTLVMQIRDQFGMVYHNHQFAHLFASEGQPARAPARRALVTVMQYIEGVGDRHAADNVREMLPILIHPGSAANHRLRLDIGQGFTDGQACGAPGRHRAGHDRPHQHHG